MCALAEPGSRHDSTHRLAAAAEVDLDAVATALRGYGYEPLISNRPSQSRRIWLAGHGGYVSTGRFGWLLATPGHPPRSLRDARGRWVTLDMAPEKVADAVAATDGSAPQLPR